MKRLILFTVFLGMIGTGSFFVLKKPSCKNKLAIPYQLNNKNYCLLVADSSDEWINGLMNIKKPVDFDGMIFVFPDKQIRTFWNKNTYLDLDVYWLTDSKIVNYDLLPSIEKSKKIITVKSPVKINRVIELIR